MQEPGKQQAEFSENTKATGANLLIGIACLGLGAILLFSGFNMKADDGLFNKVLFILSGAFSLLGGVGALYTNWKHRGERVVLNENGLLIERGGKRHAAAWDEIAAVTEKVEKMYLRGQYIYDRYLYTIEKQDGETFTVSNMVSDVDGFGRALKEKTFARLHTQALEALERGERVRFGSLLIDTNGLEESGGRFLWTQLSGVKVKEGLLEVKDRDGKAIMSGQMGSTPNAHVLVALLKKHLPFERV